MWPFVLLILTIACTKNICGLGQHSVVQGKKKYVIILLKMDQYWFFSVYFALLFWIQAFFPYSNSLIHTHTYTEWESERERERGKDLNFCSTLCE